MLSIYLSMIETQEEKDKFEELYYKYKGIIYCIALEYMEKDSLVEDAAQETFIKLIRYMDGIEDIEDHKTFTFVRIVAKSVCLDMLRKEKSYQAKKQQLFKFNTDSIDDTELYIMLESLTSLPEIYRDALMLKYYYKLDEKEISFITNISRDGVYKRIARAKMLLKEEGI